MNRSETLFERAKQTIPGGVNSPVRAFKAVGGTPRFMERSEGAYIWDADGNRYTDYVLSWGPMIMGHNHPEVREAVIRAAETGLSFGCPTEIECEVAELIIDYVPSVELVRMCSSGTEATMSALRLARGATGRDKIIKFEGCYHGHSDSLLIKAGSGALTFGVPSSPGVPEVLAQHTVTLPFNDTAALQQAFDEIASDLACVIIEPITGNMNCILPEPGFLETLRELCSQHGVVLIFDEVMTGFRVHPQSAQGRYGVTPDLSCFGKVVGGGYPLAAFGGRADLMSLLAPEGPVYQAGTLSGNPVAVAAGLATVQALTPDVYARLEQIGAHLDTHLASALEYHGCSYVRVGGMFSMYFRDQVPTCFSEVKECDLEAFGRFFRASLAGGVYLPPSQYEAVFLSAALSDAQVEQVVSGITSALVAAHV